MSIGADDMIVTQRSSPARPFGHSPSPTVWQSHPARTFPPTYTVSIVTNPSMPTLINSTEIASSAEGGDLVLKMMPTTTFRKEARAAPWPSQALVTCRLDMVVSRGTWICGLKLSSADGLTLFPILALVASWPLTSSSLSLPFCWPNTIFLGPKVNSRKLQQLLRTARTGIGQTICG
jgi:hypothetical protein